MTVFLTLESLVHGLWEEILKIPCRQVCACENLPVVKIGTKSKIRDSRFAETTMAYNHLDGIHFRGYIEIFPESDGTVAISTLVHELLHARGFQHGKIRGLRFASTASKDMASPEIAKALGLDPNTKLKIYD